jgi:hypothetical protein
LAGAHLSSAAKHGAAAAGGPNAVPQAAGFEVFRLKGSEKPKKGTGVPMKIKCGMDGNGDYDADDISMPALENSWEDHQEDLDNECDGFLNGFGIASDYDDQCFVFGVFGPPWSGGDGYFAIICAAQGREEPIFYKAAFEFDAEMEPHFTGVPIQVEVQSSVAPLAKMIEHRLALRRLSMEIKSGAAVSAKNMAKLQDATDLIDQTGAHPKTHVDHKAMCSEAAGHLKAVLGADAATDPEDLDPAADPNGHPGFKGKTCAMNGCNKPAKDGEKLCEDHLAAKADTFKSIKAGRVLSQANYGKVKAAHGLCQKMIATQMVKAIETPMLHKAGVAMLKEACMNMKDVMDEAETSFGGGPGPSAQSPMTASDAGAKLLGLMAGGDEVPVEIAVQLRDKLDESVKAKELDELCEQLTAT